MKLAFVYAGQGSQKVAMGQDLYNEFPTYRKYFDYIDEDLKTMCFEGPIEKLSDTRNTQPIMVAFAIALTEVLKEKGIVPEMVAGLSLGEYSALYTAGFFGAKQAIDFVQFRGNEMAKATVGISSKMVAIINLDREKIQKCCDEASSYGIVQIANYNCPGQIVIGGEITAVDRAVELALDAGARKCIPLAVSGPFHTAFMKPAGDALFKKLSQETFGELKIPVVFNCTALTLGKDETVANLLERQVQQSVKFEDSIRFMESEGIDTIVEIGPGKVLSGFIKKISKEIKILNVEDVASLNNVVEILKGELV
ncbi:MAG: ACP S-malonyltransferase [Anaerovoracaceae bacterium]